MTIQEERLRSPRTIQEERLRSPRGSPRHLNNAESCIHYLLFVPAGRFGILMVLFVCAFVSSTNFRAWETAQNINNTAVVRSDSRNAQESSVESGMPWVAQKGSVPSTTKTTTTTPATETTTDTTAATTTNIPQPSKENLPTNRQASIAAINKLGEVSLGLQSYNASLHPLLRPEQYQPSKQNPIQVQLLLDVSSEPSIRPPSKFIMDGLERSEYIHVVGITYVERRLIKHVQVVPIDPNKRLVWVVDWESLNRDCHILHRARQSMQQQQQQPSDVFLVLMDYSGSTRQNACSKSHGGDNATTRLVKRSIVQNRHYHEKSMHVGEIVPNQGMNISSGPTLHAPLPLREQFVDTIRNQTSDPFSQHRPIDIAFFWDAGDAFQYSLWRRRIAKVVKEFKDTSSVNETLSFPSILVQTIANDMVGMELGNIQPEYVQQLLSSKIVVIAQRDEWEDHYRLLESLASGALVVTDQMLALPDGLANTTNLLIYRDSQSLRSILRYYSNPKNEAKRLEIAKRGWKVAMGQHRSWHRMEQVLFGTPLTLVHRPTDPAPRKKSSNFSPSLKLLGTESFV